MKKFIFTIIISLICVVVSSVQGGENQLQIFILDVGQGDSILIISPDNKKLLIDAGKDDLAASNLQSILGVFNNNIDYVLITHPDSDHAGGYKYIEDFFTVGMKIENTTENSDFTLGCCVSIDFVWPQNLTNSNNTNANSAAFFLQYENVVGFFGGDLPQKEEDTIAKEHQRDISLLKVSHHGSSSSTSSYMLSVFKPEIALISVGKNNSYHHPSDGTLRNLQKADVKVFRTDELGTIHLISDGQIIRQALNN